MNKSPGGFQAFSLANEQNEHVGFEPVDMVNANKLTRLEFAEEVECRLNERRTRGEDEKLKARGKPCFECKSYAVQLYKPEIGASISHYELCTNSRSKTQPREVIMCSLFESLD